MSTLPISPVRFVEDKEAGIHKYFKGFDELHGVTEILKDVIFYDKYAGIDEETLMNAAKRGTAIHECVQADLMKQVCTIAEYAADMAKALKSWQAFINGTGLLDLMQPDSVEYLVSDEKEIASKVDIVFKNKNGYVLADIKTTTALDEEYLSWQLSIYADLFRAQTGENVDSLLALWYDRKNDSWTAKAIKDKGHDEVHKLIDDWHNGVKRVVEVPAPVIEISNYYKDIEIKIKSLENERNEFRTRLMDMMKEYGVKSVKIEGFSATYKEPTERKTFDVKKLQAEHPELNLEPYYKTSSVSESILVKIDL